MILYLDSSSAVKVYLLQANVVEGGAEAVRELVVEAEVAASSRVTYVEIIAALARARRARRIRQEEQYQQVVRAFQQDWPRYFWVPVSIRLVREAGRLAQRYVLKAYDAVQLASALELRRNLPTDLRFSSYDNRLKRAAQAEGLTIA